MWHVRAEVLGEALANEATARRDEGAAAEERFDESRQVTQRHAVVQAAHECKTESEARARCAEADGSTLWRPRRCARRRRRSSRRARGARRTPARLRRRRRRPRRT